MFKNKKRKVYKVYDLDQPPFDTRNQVEIAVADMRKGDLIVFDDPPGVISAEHRDLLYLVATDPVATSPSFVELWEDKGLDVTHEFHVRAIAYLRGGVLWFPSFGVDDSFGDLLRERIARLDQKEGEED